MVFRWSRLLRCYCDRRRATVRGYAIRGLYSLSVNYASDNILPESTQHTLVIARC